MRSLIYILNFVTIKLSSLQLKINFIKLKAGAQGEHKIARGYLPELTYSNHWFGNHELSEAITNYLDDEGKKIIENINILKTFSPFKT